MAISYTHGGHVFSPRVLSLSLYTTLRVFGVTLFSLYQPLRRHITCHVRVIALTARVHAV